MENKRVNDNRKSVELLAPVGDWETLTAAVQAGANAIYLGGKSFGARKHAGNFSNEELEEVVKYCHIRDVRVYVTVNILIYEREVEEVLKFVGYLDRINVDAIIMQDIGLISKVRNEYPSIEIHGSTQLTPNSIEDFKFLKKIGLSRVVASRELSTMEIKEIKENVDIEIEGFVHGALCLSYSGQCLMSSMIGGRSGNRGDCAQTCRKKYKLIKNDIVVSKEEDGKDFMLSPKDLKTIDRLDEIIDSGLDSLKIEGRMKGEAYVYTVVSEYRKKIESLENGTDYDSGHVFNKIFNRGFTEGQILATPMSEFLSNTQPGNKGEFIGRVMGFTRAKMKVKLETTLRLQDDIQIRRNGESIGGRVEVLTINDERVKEGKPGDVIKVNFKHEVHSGEAIYRTYDKLVNDTVKDAVRTEANLVGIEINFKGKVGEQAEITVKDKRGNEVTIKSESPLEMAQKVGASEEKLLSQIDKLGSTPYFIEKSTFEIDDNLFVSAKEVNKIRREAIEKLSKKREKFNSIEATFVNEYAQIGENGSVAASDDTKLAEEKANKNIDAKSRNKVIVYDLDHLELIRDINCDDLEYGKIDIEDLVFYDDFETIEDAIKFDAEYKDELKEKLIPVLPRITKTRESKMVKETIVKLLEEEKIDSVMISTYGQFEMMKEIEKERNVSIKLWGNYSLNIINKFTYEFYEELGLIDSIISPEVKPKDFVYNREVDYIDDNGDAVYQSYIGESSFIKHGRVPVMVSEYCVISDNIGGGKKDCQLCKNNVYELEDIMGEKYPMRKMLGCRMEILSAITVYNKNGKWIIITTEDIDERQDIESVRV